METTIKNFYKESNETQDMSGDYRVITISASTYQKLYEVLIDASVNGRKQKQAEIIINLLDNAMGKAKAEWY